MRRWRLPILLLLGTALAGALGCRSIRAPTVGTLLIGVRADAPPLCFRAKGQWQGVEVELGRALAARLNLQPVFKAYPAEDLTDALLNGKVDVIMAGLPITPEKRLLMDFASPYLVSGQAAIVRTPDLPHANTLIKIRSARIRIGDQTLTVLGTHALAPYNAAMWKGRNRFLRRLARHLRDWGTPLVVTGDFNNTPWSEHFQTFLRESGLTDSAQGRGPLPTWPASRPFL
ncbi:MAG TPA: transporter substrate-binding domain-containing protein, partial [Kiritimatiellia bacterium]|nr:transporter substrate-binding domain-containing protein [Kiritimatiellia bacterium]